MNVTETEGHCGGRAGRGQLALGPVITALGQSQHMEMSTCFFQMLSSFFPVCKVIQFK